MRHRRAANMTFPNEDGYPVLRASVTHRVGFSEVDPMGIVWFGRYSSFFEEASAVLRDVCGLSHAAFFSAKVQPPIVKYEVEYLHSSRLDEVLTVTACLHGTEAARLNMSFQIYGKDGQLRVAARTVQVFMDMQTQSVCMVPPPIWRDCLARWKKGAFACLQD